MTNAKTSTRLGRDQSRYDGVTGAVRHTLNPKISSCDIDRSITLIDRRHRSQAEDAYGHPPCRYSRLEPVRRAGQVWNASERVDRPRSGSARNV
jgi:hypothetical protein